MKTLESLLTMYLVCLRKFTTGKNELLFREK